MYVILTSLLRVKTCEGVDQLSRHRSGVAEG